MANDETIKRAAGALGITVADFNQLPEKVREGALKMVQSNELLTQAVSGSGKISLHLGEKGTIVMRGFGRFPHSFYVEQSDKMFEFCRSKEGWEQYQAFKSVNKDKLKTKAQAVVSATPAAG